jgi:hypothetical protein
MALTYIRNAKVSRVFYEGKGAEFVETFQKQDGSEGSAKYTAWFDAPHGLSEGAVGNVSGLTGVKARIWTPDDGEPRAVADIVLNSARFETAEDDGSEPF